MSKQNTMNKNILFLILSFVFLFSIAQVSAISNLTSSNISIQKPATSATISGIYNFNFSIVPGYEGQNWTNVSVYLKSASTGNSSWTLVGVSRNSTRNDFNSSFISYQVEDANDYIINFTLMNGTGTSHNFVSVTVTGLTINNTIPNAPSSISPADGTTLTSAATISFSGAVNNTATTTCTYIIGSGGTAAGDADSGTATYSASNCSFSKTFSTSSDNGIWYYTITASDGNDNKVSSVQSYQVAIASTASGGGGSSPNYVEVSSVQIQVPSNQKVGIIASIGNAISSFFNSITNLFKR